MNRPYTSAPKQYDPQTNSTDTLHLHQESVTNYKPIFYVPKSVKGTQNINELQSSAMLRSAPKSRDFKKTIPKNINQDKERLYEELNKCKERYNLSKLENYKLKSKIQNQDEEMVRLAEFPSGTRTAHQYKEQPQQAQTSITLTLKKQVAALSDALEDKEEEMIKIKRNVKLTKIYEIEAELKGYQDETIRLKHMIQQFLRTRHKGQINQSLEDKYLSQMGQVEELEGMVNELQNQIVSITEALKSQMTTFQDLEINYQKVVKDKTLLQKILQDKEKDIDRLKGNESTVNRRTTHTQDGQLKLELERKLIECNQLKNQNTLKERKNHELEKKLKELTIDLTAKLNLEMREKITNKDKSEKYRIELIELQDKYQQLVFNSRIAVPSGIQSPLQRKKTFNSNHSEDQESMSMNLKMSLHQTHQQLPSETRSSSPALESSPKGRRTTIKNLPIVTKDGVEQIGTELRYKLRGKQIRATEIDHYLFTESIRSKDTVNIGELITQLQKEPFCLPQNESVNLSRFLIEPQGVKEVIYNMHLSNDLATVVQTLTNIIGKYSLILGDERFQIHDTIRKEFQEKQEEIKSVLKLRKAQENSRIPGNCYSRDSFLMALVQTALDKEQQDVFMQTLYEITNDFNIIDLDIINKHWPPQGQLLLKRAVTIQEEQDNKLPQIREEPQVVKQTIDAILGHADTNNLSIFDLRSIIDEDKSGFIDRSELVKFLKSCRIDLNKSDLMDVVDFFDEAGDGRISVNDLGSVLKTAQHKREDEYNAKESGNKSIEALINIVAQYINKSMKDSGHNVVDFFAMIEESKQGLITKEEMRRFFRTKLVIPISSDEFDDFYEVFEQSPDGDLEYSEFVKVIGPALRK